MGKVGKAQLRSPSRFRAAPKAPRDSTRWSRRLRALELVARSPVKETVSRAGDVAADRNPPLASWRGGE